MYYAYPEDESAYNCKNEFFFGTEFIVAPITEHTSDETNLAGVNVWVPEGRYTDIFTDRIYEGNQFVKMYRDIDNIPVLAKQGAIIPMSKNDRVNDCSNPEEMEVLIYRGNNTFTLYEDDGESLSYQQGEYLKTDFTVSEDADKVTLTINKKEGDISVVPERRTFTLMFKDITSADVSVSVNGRAVKAQSAQCGKGISVTVSAKAGAKIEVTLENCTYLENEDRKQQLTNVISKFQMSTDVKGIRFGAFIKGEKDLPANLPEHFAGPIEEIIKLKR